MSRPACGFQDNVVNCPVSRQRLLGGRGLELNLPLEHTCAGGGSFGLGHLASVLQSDRERRMSERVRGSESCQRHRGCDGLIDLTGIAQSANKSVVSLIVGGICGDCGAKCIGGFNGRTGSEKGEAFLGKRFGGLWIGRGHGCL
jgi:hypothetical protein